MSSVDEGGGGEADSSCLSTVTALSQEPDPEHEHEPEPEPAPEPESEPQEPQLHEAAAEPAEQLQEEPEQHEHPEPQEPEQQDQEAHDQEPLEHEPQEHDASKIDVAAGDAAGTAPHQPDYLVLTAEHVQEIEDFRAELRRLEANADRLALCNRKRVELLARDECPKVVFAGFDSVMCDECSSYAADRDALLERMGSADDGKASPGPETFIASAVEGTKCLSTLRTVSRVWGLEKIRYYQWAYRGQFYCNKLRGAALAIGDWEEARVKLNRLIHRWSRQTTRRCKVEESVNPVKPDDLINLKAWLHRRPFIKKNDPSNHPLPYRKLAVSDLPKGYGFDKYGLMVHEAYATSFSSPAAPTRSVASKPKRTAASAGLKAANRRLPAKRPTGKRNGRASNKDDDTEDDDNNDDDDDDETISVESAQDEKTLEERLEGPWLAGPPRDGERPTAPPRKIAKAKPIKLTEVTWKLPKKCCAESVPPGFIAVLDGRLTCSIRELIELGSIHVKDCCCEHHIEFARLLDIKLPNGAAPAIANQAMPDAPVRKAAEVNEEPPVEMMNGRRRRAHSMSEISDGAPPLKRPRLSDSAALLEPQELQSRLRQEPLQPSKPDFHDPAGDAEYRRLWLEELGTKINDGQFQPGSRGYTSGLLLREILNKAKPPVAGDEAFFLDGPAASARVESGVYDEPIFTQGQQPFKWNDDGCRPIAQILRRMQDLGQSISVQIPSRSTNKHSFERRKLAEVKQRFLQGENGSEDPWNILDLRSPLPPCILPAFLTGENCQLLPRIRDAVLSPDNAERVLASREEWNEWTDVLEWVLLSQGGHNTAPHVDGHGLATWITAQEGRIGFGWLSRPTAEERVEWMRHSDSHAEGEWRYVVLKPGQTVFFNSGTVHFVFRAGEEQTLALGGHVLQWTGVERWIRIVIDEMRHPWSTNEEMRWSAPKYVQVVAKLAQKKVKEGRTDEMGGEAVVNGFFDQVKEFGKMLWEGIGSSTNR